ncbi:P-loop NTPase fold protein [Methanosarcina siciliae]|uniref:P-loop NTPase fold protein n=1 Tax=Methanosarcina siciliae TaxID=38027 RepID=UPI0009E28E4D
MIKSYVGDSKVYVFIDDLDRCEVPKAAELMQAINLMISDDSKVYFSLGMDRKVISAGLAAKNEKVVGYLEVEGIEFGYEFIEKFIQLPFKVPRIHADP